MAHPERAGKMDVSPAKSLLRFITCGSVDDGKSTLIGRLLHDAKLILDDQLVALAADSRRHGTTGDELDFALLVDGLEAEREQGITIDVAHRYFATDRRTFIVADTPGHEQYTRNMATAASNAELAVVLVDARKGVLPQTRRHALICSLLGVRHVLLAVNKIDLVDFSSEVFSGIVEHFRDFAAELQFQIVIPIPISARYGDNVRERSLRMRWYDGPTLVETLETIQIDDEHADKPLRFPVQWVNRSGSDFRGYAGTVASGSVRPGDMIAVSSSGRQTQVKEIVTYGGPQAEARAGDAVTLTVADEIDIARGDVLAAPRSRPEISDQFAAHIIWMSEEALLPGRSYLARIGTKTTPISITAIKHRIDVNTRQHLAATTLILNDIAWCNVSTRDAVAFDAYEQNRKTGSFVIIDRFSNHTVGAGLIAFALRRSSNIHWQTLSVDKGARSQIKQQRAAIVWFTGLSGAGKSTIANMVEQKLYAAGHHSMLLDGDNMRHGLNRDLGFTEADRVENIRRAGEVAKLMTDAGLLVLCSFISPYRAEREMVRRLVAEDEFIEVFVDASLDECMRRDPKGLYAKAKAGQIRNFTGFDAPYEPPQHPEVQLRTADLSPEDSANEIIRILQERKIIG